MFRESSSTTRKKKTSTADDVEVTLGGEGVQQEFTDNLTGVKADDEKTFVVDYPEDFSSPGTGGKEGRVHRRR